MTDTIHIIGAGAAGSSLAWALHLSGMRIVGVTDKDPARAESLAERLGAQTSTRIEAVKRADTVILSVSDPMIAQAAADAVQRALPAKHQIWFHLSGALSPNALAPIRERALAVGAFHPAHVFPPGEITPIAPGTRFGVDGDAEALRKASELAAALGGKTVRVTEEMRPCYHAAAVMASNAVVALLAEARNVLVHTGIDAAAAESLLLSLTQSAVKSCTVLGLDNALTGPIQRGDAAMVDRHLDALKQLPGAAGLYRSLGMAIVALTRNRSDTPSEALDKILKMLEDV